MSVSKTLFVLVAPAALLTLSACATGLPTRVSRFQALPPPAGQSFVIQAADPRKQGGLEFGQYADLVRRNLVAQGYSEAATPQSANLVVMLDYGVDDGRTEIRTTPGGRFGTSWGSPFYSRFGYFGHRGSPFYYGWRDPWFYDLDYPEIDSYTVYTSYLDMDIKRAADGQALFEGTAKARSRVDALPVLVPNLVEAMFTGFPGNSGETVRITVQPERRRG